MKYAKIKDNTVQQIQPYPQDGLIDVPDHVICGMIRNEDGTFSNPKRSRDQKRRDLQTARDEIINSAIDNVQVARSVDRENINDAIRKWEAIGSPDSIAWILEDNTNRDMTKADLQAIEDQYAIRKMQTFARYQELLVDLENSETPETIVWTD